MRNQHSIALNSGSYQSMSSRSAGEQSWGWWSPVEDGAVYTFSAGQIAKSISKLCRFTGHTGVFYSVAEHSVAVSRMVPEELALEALMHDAHEMLIGDMAYPLKQYLKAFEQYQLMEKKAERDVRTSQGLPIADSAEVQLADRYMALIELHYLLDVRDTEDEMYDMAMSCVEHNKDIIPVGRLPIGAEHNFLNRYEEITGGASYVSDISVVEIPEVAEIKEESEVIGGQTL